MCFRHNFGFFYICKLYLKSVIFGDNWLATMITAMNGAVIEHLNHLIVFVILFFQGYCFIKSTLKTISKLINKP